jgi:hypothetical protein
VALDGSPADEQPLADLRVRVPERDQAQDFDLLVAEPVGRPRRRLDGDPGAELGVEVGLAASGAAERLSTKPTAPAFSASRANAGSSCIVRTTIWVSGASSRSAGIAARLGSPGMLRSRISTRGRCART